MNKDNSTGNKKYLTELKLLVTELDNHQGEWHKEAGGDEIEPGVIQMPHVITDPLAMQAMKFLYENNLIIDFDWVKWEVGREFFTNTDPSKYDKLDKDQVLKLLTAVARNDRFCEGAWSQLFESGDAQKLYRRLLEIEESQK